MFGIRLRSVKSIPIRSELFVSDSLVRSRSRSGLRLSRPSRSSTDPHQTRRKTQRISCQTTSSSYGLTRNTSSQKTKSAMQSLLSSIPPMVASLAAFGLVAVGGVLGWFLSHQLPDSVQYFAKYICVIIGGALGALLSKLASDIRLSAAQIDLYNIIISRDPTTLSRSHLEALGQSYGLNISRDLNRQLCAFYDRYLESCIPKGEASLHGGEAAKILSFKTALGLTDEEAALVHMDVGRRLSRSAFETESRADKTTSRKAFQRWIYVSYLVFGERKASFLLPLRRVFGLSQAQITVAIRDNAKAVFNQKIEQQLNDGAEMNREFLQKLRSYQLATQLSDEIASEVISEFARKKVESNLSQALDSIRDRTKTKDVGLPMRKMTEVLEFNQRLTRFASEASSDLPPGLNRVSIHGGAFERASSSADQRELFQLFLEEKLVSLEGQFTIKLSNELDELMFVLGLGPKEAERITNEVSSGRLDSAESKAAVLQRLCDRLQFRPEMAAAMHKTIYKQKMESSLKENGKITNVDEQDLERIRTLMCIPDSDALDVMRGTVGGKFKAVLDDVLAVGYDNFSKRERDLITKSMQELRISTELAKEMLESSVKKLFLQYITASRLKQNILEQAKELKKMIFFSNIVVAPVLQDIKGTQVDMTETMKQFSETLAKASKELDTSTAVNDQSSLDDESTPSTLSKATKAKEDFESGKDEIGNSGVKMTSQKEITLKNELEERDRLDIYRNYLLYCMSGDVISMPMGGSVVLERDNTEFGRLSQLGDILGLSQFDVMKVHSDLAEQAFRQQVKATLSDGALTKEKTEALTEMQTKMGLSSEQAQKIIKGVQNERMASSLQSAKAMGDLNIQKLLDMKDTGVEIESFTSPEFRRRLYQQEAEKVMSDGQGLFDEDYMFVKLPTSLSIDPEKAKQSVEEVANDKKRLQVVQAMSDLRMKKLDDVVYDVNNLLVCAKILGLHKAANGSPIWERKEEVLDLYSVYYWKTKDVEKTADLQVIFKIADSEAEALREVIDNGEFRLAEEVKDEEVFF
eukprot:g2576.t1